jgi:hypothetical protein
MEAKRQRANTAREALGKQVVPWNFGTPASASNSGYGQAQPPVGQTPQQNQKTEPTREEHGSHRPQNTDLTWDEFLHDYALPFSNQRIGPLNQQQAVRWTFRHTLDR